MLVSKRAEEFILSLSGGDTDSESGSKSRLWLIPEPDVDQDPNCSPKIEKFFNKTKLQFFACQVGLPGSICRIKKGSFSTTLFSLNLQFNSTTSKKQIMQRRGYQTIV
jgi:hypothetical protein